MNGATRGDFNLERLRGSIPDFAISQIQQVCEKFEINTPLRLSHFLAQCAHESSNFRLTEENLNYSTQGLLKTFGKYFPNQNLAESYQKQPEKIASRVYGNRMGNGDESSKEGYKFRGRGYIQLTGKENYTRFDTHVTENILENPDLVSTKYPMLSAAWFFKNSCLTKCDEGSSVEVITKVTRCVNGGTNGLDDRIKYFNKFYNLLK